MTTPFWCLFLAIFIPYLLAGYGGVARRKQFGVAENHDYRNSQIPKLQGAGSRAYAAQANAWEAIAVFTAAVTVAHLAGADPRLSAVAAMIWLGARIVHPILYIADLATLRTISFVVGLGASIWLFALAIRA